MCIPTNLKVRASRKSHHGDCDPVSTKSEILSSNFWHFSTFTFLAFQRRGSNLGLSDRVWGREKRQTKKRVPKGLLKATWLTNRLCCIEPRRARGQKWISQCLEEGVPVGVGEVFKVGEHG